MTSEAERAYAAGFLDGEGCIAIIKGGRNPNNGDTYFQAGVYVSQVDPTPLLWLREHWGGTITAKKGSSGTRAWQWHVRSQLAYSILRDVLPYLQVKRANAENALKLAELRKGHVKAPLTQDDLAARRALQAESKRLNTTAAHVVDALPG